MRACLSINQPARLLVNAGVAINLSGFVTHGSVQILAYTYALNTIVHLSMFVVLDAWTSINVLMLNQEKTELKSFKPKHQLKVSGKIQLQVGENTDHVARSWACIVIHP